MTRPRTRLRFGQKAIVPFRDYHPLHRTYQEGVLGIVVKRLRRAPASRLRGNFDEDSRKVLKRSVAYHAEIVITNESGNAMSLGLPRLEARYTGPQWGHVTVFGGALPGCRETQVPKTFDHKGARWVTCKFWVTTPSRPLTEVHYLGPPYGRNAQHPSDRAPSFNEHYDLGTIVWS
ncbi:hypothetical protein ACSNOI_36090 [Actinomadura kijaniata]|uniref:hypothetical protein n=1 Tax=Actinomadura kijaniata TaxID=46161 RepID=UPI003F1DF68E